MEQERTAEVTRDHGYIHSHNSAVFVCLQEFDIEQIFSERIGSILGPKKSFTDATNCIYLSDPGSWRPWWSEW